MDCRSVDLIEGRRKLKAAAAKADMRECFDMITNRPAKLWGLQDYGLAAGKSADLVVLDAQGAEMAVAELAPVLYAFKGGRKTVSRTPAKLHRQQ